MTDVATIFRDSKTFWTQTGSVKGGIFCPQNLLEDVESARISRDDMLYGYPGDRLAQATVLDFGCGQGRLIPSIAPLVGRYIGVDSSPTCIAMSKEVAEKYKNVQLYELMGPESLAQDISAGLALTDVDLIVSWTVFQHCPTPLFKSMIKNIADGLRPGARAHFQIDWPPLNNTGLRELKWRWDQVADSDFSCRWWPEWMTWEILAKAGFEIIEMPCRMQCWRMVKKD